MKLSVRTLLAAVIFAAAPIATHCGAETIRVAVQKTGTFAWELAVIRAHGLDNQADLSIQPVELATPKPARSRCAPAMRISWSPTGCGCRASAGSAPN
jgi:NitT/TauT family transport system substrate-binding protein